MLLNGVHRDQTDKQRHKYFPINFNPAKDTANMEPSSDSVTKR